MANMSYCRFENTSVDLADCLQAIEYGEADNLNEDELRGLKSIIANARIITEMADAGEFDLLDTN